MGEPKTEPKGCTVPKDVIATAKLKYGKVAWRKFQGHEVLFRPMTVEEFDKFSAEQKVTSDGMVIIQNLCASHVIYPTGADLEALYQDMPAIKTVIGNAILKRAGVTMEQEEGEF